MTKKRKVGFVLSGEAAKGVFQARVMSELALSGVKPDVICGVSSGAINAYGYTYAGPDKTLDTWLSFKDISDVFGHNTWTWPWKKGLKNTDPLRKRLSSFDGSIPRSECIVSTVHLASGELLTFRSGKGLQEKLKEATLAAVSLPSFVDFDELCDAACRVLAPIGQAMAEDCTEIYLILGTPYGVLPPYQHRKFLGGSKAVYRFIEIMLFNMVETDLQKAVAKNQRTGYKFVPITVICPDDFLFNSFDFTQMDRAMKMKINYFNAKDLV